MKVFSKGKNGEVYNIGNSNEEISAKSLAEKFLKYSRSKVKINHIDHPKDYPSDEPDRRCPDISKAKLHLDYKPGINLKTGINRFLDFVLN